MSKLKSAIIYGAAIAAVADSILPADAHLGRHGEVAFANETRFNEATFQQALTDFAVGWRDPGGMEITLEAFAPAVQAADRFEYMEFINQEQFLSDTDDARAIGADFKNVEYTSKKTIDKTMNRGLTIRVDLDNVKGQSDWELEYTQRLLQRCYRNELRRAVTLVDAACVNTNKTWDTTAGKDPDADVNSELTTAADLVGFRPNRLIYGETAWNKRWLSHRAQNTAGGFASAALDAAGLASLLGVGMVHESSDRYSSSPTARSQIVASNVYMIYGASGANADDPSTAKRFWTPCEGGSKFRVYREQKGPKIIEITVEYYSKIKITSTLGARKFTIS
jgi:hypothetical protein